jgi:nucleotide-binding universal stress UspA family protein
MMLHVEKKPDPKHVEEVEEAIEKQYAHLEHEMPENEKVVVQRKITYGKIDQSIAKTAASKHADLIIMNTHGSGGLTHLGRYFRGSHTARTVRLAPCSVISIKEKRNPVQFKNLLLPLDMSKETTQKVSRIIEWAKAFNSTIHLLSISLFLEGIRHDLKPLKVKLEEAADYIKSQGVKCTKEMVRHESISAAIIEYSEEIEADMIVIMTQEESKLNELFLGSRAKRVIANSKIPVLSLKPR